MLSLKHTLRFVALSMLVSTCAACSIQRTVVNPQFQHLDRSWIQPGTTTFQQVLERFGPPVSVADPQGLINLQYSTRALRYTSYDKKVLGFITPAWIALDFAWEDTQPIFDLVVEFSPDRTVSQILEGKSQALWKPFSSEEDRPPLDTRRIQ